MQGKYISLVLVLGIFTSACSTVTTSGISKNYKIGKPYQIAGQWYYPREDFYYNQTGMASWYGPGFHGKKTANGETYNQNDITAAHPTLPLPSMVKVTNLSNGKELLVRVNDRGPFAKNRIIDLSEASAKKLGFKHKGVEKVRVQYLPEESYALLKKLKIEHPQLAAIVKGQHQGRDVKLAAANLPASLENQPVQSDATPEGSSFVVPQLASVESQPLPDIQSNQPVQNVAVETLSYDSAMTISDPSSVGVRTGDYFIQVGSYQSYDNAIQTVRKLESVALTQLHSAQVNGIETHRVRVGPIESERMAKDLLEKVELKGYKGAFILEDPK